MDKVKKKKRKFKLIYVVIPILLVATGISVYLWYPFNKEDAPKETYKPGDIVTISVDIPSEETPTEFSVAPDLPKVITIPAISVKGYIQSVGIDQDGLIAVPTNVHLAGWYINSVRPGEEGLSIMDGHKDGTTLGGIFKNVEKLKKGDNLSIEYGDATIKEFKVVDVKKVSIEDAFDLMYEKREAIERQLNLVSCGGRYNKEKRTYDDRIIVIAEGI